MDATASTSDTDAPCYNEMRRKSVRPPDALKRGIFKVEFHIENSERCCVTSFTNKDGIRIFLESRMIIPMNGFRFKARRKQGGGKEAQTLRTA